MQSNCVYPTLGSRTSPKEWVELGKPNLIAQATARKEEILASAPAAALSPDLDAAIRAKFNIHLPARPA
jgi:trimethylamine--corrinoid protein Co-methyltransferase